MSRLMTTDKNSNDIHIPDEDTVQVWGVTERLLRAAVLVLDDIANSLQHLRNKQ